MEKGYSSYDVKFLKNLTHEQIAKIKKEQQQIKDKLKTEDSEFYDKFLKLSKGNYSVMQPLLAIVNAKSFTPDEYDFLLREYALDRLGGKDIENSAALAVLLLGHERFLTFVKRKLQVPSGIDSDDLDSVMRFGLRRTIDNFDFTQEYKFSTYAFEIVSGYAKTYIRDEYHKNNQFKNQSLEQNVHDDFQESSKTLLDTLGVDDEFIASFADGDSAENILKQVGWFDVKTQFAFLAKLNGMKSKEITDILKTSSTNYHLMLDSARQELRNILTDPGYIQEEKFRDFVYKDGSISKICVPYYRLTQEDFSEIVKAQSVDGMLLKISKKLGKDMLSRKEFFDPLSDNVEIAQSLGFFDEKIQFILMAMRQGMTAEEIAGALNVAKNTVMADYWQARKELKNILCDPDYIKSGYKNFKRNSNLSFVRLPYHLLGIADFDKILEQAARRPKKEKIDFLNDARIEENLGYFEDVMQFIVMARREGMSNIEIAKILDMKPKTISDLFSKLKAEFKCIFAQPDYTTQGYKNFNFRNNFSSVRHPYKRFTEQEFNDVLDGKFKFERHRKRGFAGDENNLELPEK